MNMMKTFLLFLVLVGSTSIFAHFPISVQVNNDHGIFSAEWSPIQFGFLPGTRFQLFRENTEIYGIAFSPVALHQKSAILSVAPGSMLKSNYFLQVSGFLTATEKNYGISFSPFLNFVFSSVTLFQTRCLLLRKILDNLHLIFVIRLSNVI